MTKYICIILLVITNGCGYGQYPKLKMYRGEIYNANDYTQTQFDSLLNSGVILGWDTSSGVSPDTVYYVYPLTIKDTVMNYSSLGFNDYEGVSVSRTIYADGDTIISVDGDSLTAIKNLFNSWQETLNSIPRTGTFKYTSPNDTIPVIMQVSDTSRQAWDTKIYWMKGYKVIGDYDTYYLDILKQPLKKLVIVWLDQNL